MPNITSLPILAVAALALLAPAAHAEAPMLEGRWVSAAPEAQGPIWATRDFTFEGDAWTIRYDAFADAEGTQPIFTLDVGGRFVLGGPSATVEGAHEGVFPATHRSITAHGEGGAAMFAGMGCLLTPGEAKDLTSEGCGFVPSLMSAMGEYDLVAMREDGLHLGDRAGDLTKERPAALTPFRLVRP